MKNEPMYDTFVKNRTPNEKRIKPNDIPDFGYDIDEPTRSGRPTYDRGNAVGVNHSVGGTRTAHSTPTAKSRPANAPVGISGTPTFGGNPGDTNPIKSSQLREPEGFFSSEPSKAQAQGSSSGNFKGPFEFEDASISLPDPHVFNSYPAEVQRKIMEWTDRDIKARRDDESRRQDAILRAKIARDRTKIAVPVAIVILCIVCALITGIYTKRAILLSGFLVVAVVVIIATAVSINQRNKRKSSQQQFPKV